jgi:hypothetical protein
MYRSEVVRSQFPFFDPAVPHADTEAAYRTCRDWDFGFVHQVLSFARVENESRMGMVSDYAPFLLDKFIVDIKFGHDFLSPDEYREVYERDRSNYFRWLGEAAITNTDAALWGYHREGLATVGFELKRYKLWKYMLLAMPEMLVHPRQTVRRLTK